MLWNILGIGNHTPQAFDSSQNGSLPVQNSQSVSVSTQNSDSTVMPSGNTVTQDGSNSTADSPIDTPSEAVNPVLNENEALEKLLSFEKKIMSSTPPHNPNSKRDADEAKNIPPEVLRARNALKLGNPFRGV